MQKQFPDDINVLLSSSISSIGQKKYTKAINLLKKTLNLDSLNIKGKQLLARAYLEKSMYELSKNKEKNAAIDLANARTLVQHANPPCLIYICDCLIAYTLGETARFNEQLGLAYDSTNGKLLVNYIILHYLYEFKGGALFLSSQLMIWDKPDSTALTTMPRSRCAANYRCVRCNCDLSYLLKIEESCQHVCQLIVHSILSGNIDKARDLAHQAVHLKCTPLTEALFRFVHR